MLITASPPAATGFWARTHHQWETAGYVGAGLITLALVPALFVAIDHAIVVRWCNEVFDLIGLR